MICNNTIFPHPTYLKRSQYTFLFKFKFEDKAQVTETIVGCGCINLGQAIEYRLVMHQK